MADALVTVEPKLEIDGRPIEVESLFLHEEMCEVPLLQCTVTHGEETPAAADVLRKQVKLVLERSDGSQVRHFHGQIVDVERYVEASGNPTLLLTVAPRMWRLGKRTDCRTFQEMAVPDVIKKVLEGAGVPADSVTMMLSGSYPTRKLVCQYRETDLDFVQRLCAEEGIFWASSFSEDKDEVFFGDAADGFGDVTSGPTTLPFKRIFGHSESRDIVQRVRKVARVRTDKVTTRDFDFEKPKLKLESKVEGKDDGAKALEVYTWPGRFLAAAEGKRLAQVLLDSLQAERDVVGGQTGVLHLSPGRCVAIEEHPYDTLNARYFLTGIDVVLRRSPVERAAAGEVEAHQYECRFTGIPMATSQYRPRRREAARHVPELQTAFTTGPSGKEIHTEKHARVKVWFHWDRVGKKDDTSSPWVRTCQLPTGGAIFIPRVGWESAIRFEDGDVDRPMVFGRLYNGLTPPPYKLPANKARGSIQTATTPGGGSSNELRTDDTKGKEEMFFNASKDMSVDVKNNVTESVGNNETREIGSNHSLSVTNSSRHEVGASQTVSVGGNQTVNVSTFMVDDVGGDHSLTIGANRDLKIGGDHKRVVGGSSKVDVGANGIDLVVGAVSESAGGNLTHKVGAAFVQMTAKDHSVIVGGNSTENTGAAKVIITIGGRGVDVGGTMMHKVAGAIITKINGDRADSSGAAYSEIAGGATIVKADNVTFEADTLLSAVMGASTITMLPAMIIIAGVSVKLDGATVDTGALILDN